MYVGNTSKPQLAPQSKHDRIVQYREIHHTRGDFIHITLTQPGENRIETWTLPDEHLGDKAAMG